MWALSSLHPAGPRGIAGGMMELLVLAGALLAVGLAAGFVGGLFGVGGGIVIVPALYALFGTLGVEEGVRAHAAVGTSLAVIIATSLRSLRAHRSKGAVDDAVLRAWGPWIALGGAGGAWVASLVSGKALLGVFGVFALLIAGQMGFGRTGWRLAAELPHGLARAGLGAVLGLLSALMGIGGGAFGVTLMTLCGRPIHQAVGTASGFGVLIAIPSAIGFILAGWGVAGRPPFSAGYVNLIGLIVLSALTMFTAPIGARFAHRLDQTLLRRLFAVFLAVMSLNFLRKAFGL